MGFNMGGIVTESEVLIILALGWREDVAAATYVLDIGRKNIATTNRWEPQVLNALRRPSHVVILIKANRMPKYDKSMNPKGTKRYAAKQTAAMKEFILVSLQAILYTGPWSQK